MILLFFAGLIGCRAKAEGDPFFQKLADSALTLTKDRVVYDPSYYAIEYPGGDVPKGKGVCTDVVIRSYRKVGIDLQKEVHEDMLKAFNEYPKSWGLSKPDPNIDHRRVPNLRKFFSRQGVSIKVSQFAKDYLPGDIVTWKLAGGLTHIGIVSNVKNWNGSRYKVIHNIGSGQSNDDCLFYYKITGHYRFKKMK